MAETYITRPAESCHWYKPDGSPLYTIIGTNGKERDTTLRDARKLGLFPSVSTIQQVADKPGLTRWKHEQIILAALTLPRLENEPLDFFASRVIEDAETHGKQAAELGTNIHAAMQAMFENKAFDHEYDKYVYAVDVAMDDEWPSASWICERSFSHPLGFAGKVDAYSDRVIIDWKTTGFDEKGISRLGYDEHLIQLSAYAFGLQIENAEIANIYISTKVPGLVHIHKWTEADRRRGLDMFINLFNYWKLLKQYNPTSPPPM
jgi:hypothetical protein